MGGPPHLPVPVHVIACDLVSCRLYIYIAQGLYGGVHRCALIEEDLEPADTEGFTSRALIYERGSLSLFCLSPPRNETRSTCTGVHILPSRSTTDHIEYIQEGFGRCVHLVYKSSTLQSSMYVHSMYKAPPTATLVI